MTEARESGQSYCGGCRAGPVKSACEGSLRRHNIKKAHWECWSECNLTCGFCFRTTGAPLDTERAVSLLRALSAGVVQDGRLRGR